MTSKKAGPNIDRYMQDFWGKMADCSQHILSLFIPLNKFRTWDPIVITGMSGQGIQRKTASKQSLILHGTFLE